jgi:hypothetical protein
MGTINISEHTILCRVNIAFFLQLKLSVCSFTELIWKYSVTGFMVNIIAAL